jgi:DNA modification methylase
VSKGFVQYGFYAHLPRRSICGSHHEQRKTENTTMPIRGMELVTPTLDLEQLEAAVREHTKLIHALTESVRGNRGFASVTCENIRSVGDATIYIGDCVESLRQLPDCSVQTCVTSPPYFGLRDYGHEGQIGLEPTPDEFVAKMVEVFREVRRVLRDDGTLWLNLGDSYAGSRAGPQGESGQMADRSVVAARCRSASAEMIVRGKRDASRWGGGNNPHGGDIKPKDLIGIPWRVAFALQADGWYLRQDIIWHKPNPMPESVRDRCTKAHEYIFLLSKSPKYYFDADAVKEKAVSNHPAGNKTHKYADQYEAEKHITQQHRTKAGLKELAGVEWETRNRRSVWTVTTKPFKGAHFATFPPDLIEPCVLAGAPVGGVVLDPFFGSGTTGHVALRHGRKAIGLELNPRYVEMSIARLSGGLS